MKIAIVTDSTAYLSVDQYAETGIRKVPLSVIMEGKAYREEIDMTTREFFSRIDKMDHLPTSSQPSVGDFFTVYQELAAQGYEAIISIHLSKKISGTYQNALSVADSFTQCRIYPYDSEMTSGGQAALALEASRLAEQGISPEEILESLEQLKETIQLYFVVDDLKNLVKGGRLSSAAGALGTMLKIKPVLTLKEGEIGVYDKIRTQKKALQRIEELLEQDVKEQTYDIRAYVVHADNLEKAEAWKSELGKRFPSVSFQVAHLGPVIGVHTGPGTLGMVWSKI